MQVEQRVAKSAEAFEPIDQPWIPYTLHGPRGGRRTEVEVEPGDRYASVDDVADGTLVLDVSDWPRLDREGRLYWETDPFELDAPLAEAQAVVDAAREAGRITAPDRPIRVGDVFLVRGLSVEQPSLAAATLVLDVSGAARDAAKAALYGAVASTLRSDDAEKMAVTEQYEEPEPDAGYFDVRQMKLEGPESAETAT